MTRQVDSHSEALAKAIMGDAQRKAERILARGRRDAEKIRVKAKGQADAMRKKTLDQATVRARREASLVKANVEVEARRRALSFREGIVARVLDMAAAKVEADDEADRRRSLVKLSAQAVSAIRADLVVLRVPTRDKSSLGGDFIAEVVREVGREVDICLVGDDIPSGAIAASTDGRQLCDKSLPARMRRLGPQLRVLIARKLFHSQGKS